MDHFNGHSPYVSTGTSPVQDANLGLTNSPPQNGNLLFLMHIHMQPVENGRLGHFQWSYQTSPQVQQVDGTKLQTDFPPNEASAAPTTASSALKCSTVKQEKQELHPVRTTASSASKCSTVKQEKQELHPVRTEDTPQGLPGEKSSSASGAFAKRKAKTPKRVKEARRHVENNECSQHCTSLPTSSATTSSVSLDKKKSAQPLTSKDFPTAVDSPGTPGKSKEDRDEGGQSSADAEKRSSHSIRQGAFLCGGCLKIFPTVAELDEHMESEHCGEGESSSREQDWSNPSPRKRSENGRFSNGEAGSGKRILTYRKSGNKFPCPHCSEGFPSNELLEQHKNVMHLNTRLCCLRCRKQFDSLFTLRLHTETLHTRKETCPQCARVFRSSSSLDEHLDSMYTVSQSQCTTCQVIFPSELHLILHKEVVHGLADTCIVHLQMVSPFNSTCTSTYNWPQHEQQGNETCDHCSKTFPNNWLLTKHLDEVVGHANSHCMVCGLGRLPQEFLRRHVVSSHPEIDLPCTKCEKLLNQGCFRRHVMAPRRSGIYVCQLCQMNFWSLGSFQKHLNRANGTAKHTCHICQKEMTGRVFLVLHQMSAHGMKNPGSVCMFNTL